MIFRGDNWRWWTGSGHRQIVPARDVIAMVEWCREALPPNRWADQSTDGLIWFRYESDLVLFRLRWSAELAGFENREGDYTRLRYPYSAMREVFEFVLILLMFMIAYPWLKLTDRLPSLSEKEPR